MTPQEFTRWLRTEVGRFPTQQDAAESWGISAQYLTDLLRGRRQPGEALLTRLGFRKVVRYERIEA